MINASDAPRTGNRSDILLGGNGRINEAWSVDTLLQYSGVLDEIISHDHRLQYKPERGKVLRFQARRPRPDQAGADDSGMRSLSALRVLNDAST